MESEQFNVYVKIRPGVKEFLRTMSHYYEVVVFTASLAAYANPLLDILDPEHYIFYRLFRDQCTVINNAFIKDLSQLGRDLKDVIIVDNSPIAYSLQPENGLPITTWVNDPVDNMLHQLIPILKFLSTIRDVRPYIKQLVKGNEINFTLNVRKLLERVHSEPSNQHTLRDSNSKKILIHSKHLVQLLSSSKKKLKSPNLVKVLKEMPKSHTPQEFKDKTGSINPKVEPAIRASTSIKGVFGVLKKAIDIAGKQGSFTSSQISAMYTNLLKANKSIKNRSEDYKNTAIEKLAQNYHNNCKQKERASTNKGDIRQLVLVKKDMNNPLKSIQCLTTRIDYIEGNQKKGKENCEISLKSVRTSKTVAKKLYSQFTSKCIEDREHRKGRKIKRETNNNNS